MREPWQDHRQISIENVARRQNRSVRVLWITGDKAAKNVGEVATSNVKRLVQNISSLEGRDRDLQPQLSEKYLKVGNRRSRHVLNVAGGFWRWCLTLKIQYCQFWERKRDCFLFEQRGHSLK